MVGNRECQYGHLLVMFNGRKDHSSTLNVSNIDFYEHISSPTYYFLKVRCYKTVFSFPIQHIVKCIFTCTPFTSSPFHTPGPESRYLGHALTGAYLGHTRDITRAYQGHTRILQCPNHGPVYAALPVTLSKRALKLRLVRE